MSISRESFEIAESFYRKAGIKLDEARNHKEKANYPEAVSSAQECIEFSIKLIMLLLKGEYPRKHKFTDKDFKEILDKLPAELSHVDLGRLYLISKFWAEMYTIAKYGSEELGIGPEKLFKEEEAKIAIKHAEECEINAYWVLNHFREQLIKTSK